MIVAQMLMINTSLTIWVLLPLPFLSYSIYVVSKKINIGNKRIQEQLSLITTKAQETFAGIRIIKSFGAENHFNKGFYAGYGETLDEAGYGGYKSYADPSKCQQTKTYNRGIEKNVDEKLFADGYRCGVQQASKDILLIEKQIKQEFENKQKNTKIQSENLNQNIKVILLNIL
jgi:ABC-type multidrug transport system fused ATPase/permease subunit